MERAPPVDRLARLSFAKTSDSILLQLEAEFCFD
jgi:hypothetical protein